VPAIAPGGTAAPAIIAAGPEGRGVVIVQTELAQEHPAPWWVLPARISLLFGAVVMIPATGVGLAVLLVAVWLVSGLLVRYRVRLSPARALFKGGLANTTTPGTHWLRRRWTETACSISLAPLHLDWRPAPTRLDQAERRAWLELTIELWVEPCSDELGQFRALLGLQRWQAHPTAAAKTLRAEVLDALVEHVRLAGLMARVGDGPVPVEGEDVDLALASGLRALGLELRHVGSRRITLVPRTDDLGTEDRLWIDRRPLPTA
jgi:hypothetical protein